MGNNRWIGNKTRAAAEWSVVGEGGSPFAGPYAAVPGTPEFDRLDTDQDGQLADLDDPYEPYYPGDAYVD
jgi:hypothetical protein